MSENLDDNPAAIAGKNTIGSVDQEQMAESTTAFPTSSAAKADGKGHCADYDGTAMPSADIDDVHGHCGLIKNGNTIPSANNAEDVVPNRASNGHESLGQSHSIKTVSAKRSSFVSNGNGQGMDGRAEYDRVAMASADTVGDLHTVDLPGHHGQSGNGDIIPLTIPRAVNGQSSATTGLSDGEYNAMAVMGTLPGFEQRRLRVTRAQSNEQDEESSAIPPAVMGLPDGSSWTLPEFEHENIEEDAHSAAPRRVSRKRTFKEMSRCTDRTEDGDAESSSWVGPDCFHFLTEAVQRGIDGRNKRRKISICGRIGAIGCAAVGVIAATSFGIANWGTMGEIDGGGLADQAPAGMELDGAVAAKQDVAEVELVAGKERRRMEEKEKKAAEEKRQREYEKLTAAAENAANNGMVAQFQTPPSTWGIPAGWKLKLTLTNRKNVHKNGKVETWIIITITGDGETWTFNGINSVRLNLLVMNDKFQPSWDRVVPYLNVAPSVTATYTEPKE